MKKLILLLLIALPVCANLQSCIYDHGPPPAAEMQARNLTYSIDANTPKGMAGWTLLYDMIYNPTEFDINTNDQWYIEICAAISDYEDYYFEQMEDVVDLFETFSTISRDKEDTLEVCEDIYEILYDIDAEYYDTAEYCQARIPSAVWTSYLNR